jgi:hypothetical protein
MGLGYLVAISLGGYPNSNVSLDAIVKKLEQQREVVPNNNNVGLSSPTTMLQSQHRDATAALLRGESNSVLYSRRRRASLGAGAKEIDAIGNGATTSLGEDELDYAEQVVGERKNSEILQLPAVHSKKHTFREQEDVSDDLSEAQQRFVETQKLLGSQSIPTPSNPHVMKTVS